MFVCHLTAEKPKEHALDAEVFCQLAEANLEATKKLSVASQVACYAASVSMHLTCCVCCALQPDNNLAPTALTGVPQHHDETDWTFW